MTTLTREVYIVVVDDTILLNILKVDTAVQKGATCSFPIHQTNTIIGCNHSSF